MERVVDINGINNIKTIDKHSNDIRSLLLLSDGRLASCSYKTIKIYNINNNYHCDITINGHISCINYISQLANNKL